MVCRATLPSTRIRHDSDARFPFREPYDSPNRPAPARSGVLLDLVPRLLPSRCISRDAQFAGYDAAFFYYPLYLRVRREWNAGRWPLQVPAQNGGTPLLGLPMAAVAYTRARSCTRCLPYAWAAQHLRDRGAAVHRTDRRSGNGAALRRQPASSSSRRPELCIRRRPVLGALWQRDLAGRVRLAPLGTARD